MAIYHLNAQVISRGKGRSVVAAAAYRSGERLKDNYQGLVHDYRRKGAVVFSEIFLPANAPDRLRVREILWNAVDEEEKRKDAQTARECNVALPVELDREEQKALIRNFARSLTDEGMIADVSIHDKEDGNPHAHILLTTREIQSDGTWGKKNRDWNKKEVLEGWRVRWEEMANDALQKSGSEERIDHRSNEARGVEYLPTIHEGYIARQMEKRGEVSERCEVNREICALNEALRIVDEKAQQLEAEEKEKSNRQFNQEVQTLKPAFSVGTNKRDYLDKCKDILDSDKTVFEKKFNLALLERDARRIMNDEKVREDKELWQRAKEQAQSTSEGRRLMEEVKEMDKHMKEHYKKVHVLKVQQEESQREYELVKKEKPKSGFFDFLFRNKAHDEWRERVEISKKKCSEFEMRLNEAVRISDADGKMKKEKEDELAKLERDVYEKLQANTSNPVIDALKDVITRIDSKIAELEENIQIDAQTKSR